MRKIPYFSLSNILLILLFTVPNSVGKSEEKGENFQILRWLLNKFLLLHIIYQSYSACPSLLTTLRCHLFTLFTSFSLVLRRISSLVSLEWGQEAGHIITLVTRERLVLVTTLNKQKLNVRQCLTQYGLNFPTIRKSLKQIYQSQYTSLSEGLQCGQSSIRSG